MLKDRVELGPAVSSSDPLVLVLALIYPVFRVRSGQKSEKKSEKLVISGFSGFFSLFPGFGLFLLKLD